MKGVIFRNVVYPLFHAIKRDGVNHAVCELERHQWLSTPDLMSLQQQKLERLVSFAKKNVPYYRQMFSGLSLPHGMASDSEEFLRIPILTKEIIRRHLRTLVSEDLAGNKLLSNSTSGSTGEPMRFFWDSRSIPYKKAAGIRGMEYTGWRLGDRQLILWGAPLDEKLHSAFRGRLHGWVTGRRLLSTFDLSESTMDLYIKRILEFRPVALVSYPGPLEQFAIYCQQREVRFPSVRAIITSAETLWPHQREVIEDAFGLRVFDRYGCREVGHIASECVAHNGLHISVDRLLVEVVDEEGRPCSPGEVGRVLITDLDNYGMPLIRYDIGDRGIWSEQQSCSCGRGLPLLAKIVGRTMEIVRTPDGRRIGGTFWTLLLRSRAGFRQFQVVQEQLDGVLINFVPEPSFDPTVLDYYRKRIREYCGSDFGVNFVRKNSIEVTESGKQRLIISRLKNESNTSDIR